MINTFNLMSFRIFYECRDQKHVAGPKNEAINAQVIPVIHSVLAPLEINEKLLENRSMSANTDQDNTRHNMNLKLKLTDNNLSSRLTYLFEL